MSPPPPAPPGDAPAPTLPTATTHATTTLPLHADVTAFCPSPAARHLLAAGGYELDEASGTRSGLVQLFDTRARSLRPAGPAWTGAGVLDAVWRPPTQEEGASTSPPHLALALADGTLALLAVAGGGEGGGDLCEGWLEAEEEAAPPPLSLATACAPLAIAADGPLALAAAWGGGGSALAVSTSAGTLAVVVATPAGLAFQAEPWDAHALEAWCVAWAGGGGGGGGGEGRALLLSGADDGTLKGWDMRAAPPPPSSPALAFTDGRTHGAGVTAIAPHPRAPHLLATGSYDEKARLWDARSPGRGPLLTSTLPIGGGAWRLRWHPTDPALLLLAGMHVGFAILSMSEGEDGDQPALAVRERYPHQATLAYGADWCAAPPPRASSPAASLVATASFYDNLVHLWEPATRAAVI